MTGDGCLMLVVSLIPLLYILLGCVNVSEVPKRPAYMADDGIRGFYGQRVPCGKGSLRHIQNLITFMVPPLSLEVILVVV